jgi:hypothetical protein
VGEIHQLPVPKARDDRRLIDATMGDLQDLVAGELRRALDEGRETVAPDDAVPTKVMARILGRHHSTLQKWTSIKGCPAFRSGQRPWAWPVQETKVWVREHFNG